MVSWRVLYTTFEDCLFNRKPNFVWALEILALVEERRGLNDTTEVLLRFLRIMYFERLGITHVYCYRGCGILKSD